MNETSLSLLRQLRQSPDAEAWERLHRIYAPLIQKWLIRYEIQECDTNDVVQEVLLVVSKEIETFNHNGRTGAFRTWVKGILVNRLREFWRKRDRQANGAGGSDMNQRLAELDDPASQITVIWNKDHDQHVLRELLAIVRPHFEHNSWIAFRRTMFDGESPRVVANDLGISLNAVIIAKSRVHQEVAAGGRRACGIIFTSFAKSLT